MKPLSIAFAALFLLAVSCDSVPTAPSGHVSLDRPFLHERPRFPRHAPACDTLSPAPNGVAR